MPRRSAADLRTPPKSPPRMYRSTVRPMIIGARSAAAELIKIAINAVLTLRRSPAVRGQSRLSAVTKPAFDSWWAVLLSVYWLEVAGAALRLINLHVFRRRFHQLFVGTRRQYFSLHQENNLIVVFNRRHFLRYRKKRNARIIVVNVFQNLPLRRCVHPRGKIVEQQHARIQRQGAGQHDALLLSSGKAGTSLRDDSVELLGQGIDEVSELRGGNGLFEILIFYRGAERNVLA